MNPDIDKSSRETNCDRRKARQAELNNRLVRSVSLDAGCTETSNSSKKIKLTDNEEVKFNYLIKFDNLEKNYFTTFMHKIL